MKLKYFICSIVIFKVILQVTADESDDACRDILAKNESWTTFKNNSLKVKPKQSLAFIFDSTNSMGPELEKLQKVANKILAKFTSLRNENPIEKYILTIFNDPNVMTYPERKADRFQKKLESIKVSGGGSDCPENALEGIIHALNVSVENSYAFVFTDADAKDLNLTSEVTEEIKKKKAIINVIKTGRCMNDSAKGHDVFFDLAQLSGGQVFEVSKNDSDAVVDAISIFLDKDFVKLKSEYFNSGTQTQTEIKLESLFDELVITIAGENVTHHITDSKNKTIRPSKKIVKGTMTFLKLIVNDFFYVITANASSRFSLSIGGRMNSDISIGFSPTEPSRMIETETKPPSQGVKNYLSIFPSSPKFLKCPKSIEIISNKTSTEIKLLKRNGFFITEEKLHFPSAPFKIAVYGYDALEKKIKRIIPVDDLPGKFQCH